jgi:hypothetical protein
LHNEDAMLIKLSSLLALTLSVTVPGCAVDAADPTPETSSKLGQHCVQDLETQAVSCFASFPEAISAATGGRITDAPADAHAAALDEAFAARVNALAAGSTDRRRDGRADVAPRTTLVVAVQYEDADWQGASYTYTSTFGCDTNKATVEHQVTVMPSGWNDEISSFRAFSGCVEVLYESGNFSGAQTQPAASWAYVGDAMNDQASTIRWF